MTPIHFWMQSLPENGMDVAQPTYVETKEQDVDQEEENQYTTYYYYYYMA